MKEWFWKREWLRRERKKFYFFLAETKKFPTFAAQFGRNGKEIERMKEARREVERREK